MLLQAAHALSSDRKYDSFFLYVNVSSLLIFYFLLLLMIWNIQLLLLLPSGIKVIFGLFSKFGLESQCCSLVFAFWHLSQFSSLVLICLFIILLELLKSVPKALWFILAASEFIYGLLDALKSSILYAFCILIRTSVDFNIFSWFFFGSLQFVLN